MGKFNLRNFIGKHSLSVRKKTTSTQAEEPKQEKSSESSSSSEKPKTIQCAKCKKDYEPKSENYVYSYSEKKKDYQKRFLCEKCRLKCKECRKISNIGVFIYIYNKSKSNYDRAFYCMNCYKKVGFNQCGKCKKRTDSKIIINNVSYCVMCNQSEESSTNSKQQMSKSAKEIILRPPNGWITTDLEKEMEIREEYLKLPENGRKIWDIYVREKAKEYGLECLGLKGGCGICKKLFGCCCGNNSDSDDEKKPKPKKPKTPTPKKKAKVSDDEDTTSIPLIEQPSHKFEVIRRKPEKKKVSRRKGYVQLVEEDSESEEYTEPEKPKSTTKFATRDIQGNIYVEQRHYNLTDNPVRVHGQCLWNILREHRVPENILLAAAQAIHTNIDDYVDVVNNQLQDLFTQINGLLVANNLDTIGYRLDVINYTDGDIVGGENFTYNTSADLVLQLGLLVDHEGIGHYVENRRSATIDTQITQNFHGDERAEKKHKEKMKKEVKRKEKEEEEKRQTESREREKIRKEREQADEQRKATLHQQYEALDKQHGDGLRENIKGYCSASTKIARAILARKGFKYPTADNVSTYVDRIIWMYLMFITYNWNVEEMRKDGIMKSDMKSRHFANRNQYGNRLIPDQEDGVEYDAAVPEIYGFRAFFRFVKFPDGTIYFTRDHYLTFVNIETGKMVESQEYKDEKK